MKSHSHHTPTEVSKSAATRYGSRVSVFRRCIKPGCGQPAVATLTYQYEESTAVLGPLSTTAEPSAYDLCANHAASMVAPQGWQVVRLVDRFVPAEPTEDDLAVLAEAVREASTHHPRPDAGRGREGSPTKKPAENLGFPPVQRGEQRGHLRVLPGEDDMN